MLLPIQCGERRQGYSLVLFGFDVVSWRGGIVRTSTACSVQTAPQRICRMHSKMGIQKAFHPTTTVQENPVCVVTTHKGSFLRANKGEAAIIYVDNLVWFNRQHKRGSINTFSAYNRLFLISMNNHLCKYKGKSWSNQRAKSFFCLVDRKILSDKRNNGPKMAFLKKENSACNTSLGQKESVSR